MDSVENWYRKRYALGGAAIGGGAGFGIAHLLKSSATVKLLSTIAGAGVGGLTGYHIGKRKDLERLNDVRVLDGNDAHLKIREALGPGKGDVPGVFIQNAMYSDKSLESGRDVDNLVRTKKDQTTNELTANAVSGNPEYTRTRLSQIEQYLKENDDWERASLFSNVYRHKKTHAIFDLGEYKRRLRRAVPQYNYEPGDNAFAQALPKLPNIGFIPDQLYTHSVHLPLSDEARKKLYSAFNNPMRKLMMTQYGSGTPNRWTSSPGTVSGTHDMSSDLGNIYGHEYNHVGSARVSNNLLPANTEHGALGGEPVIVNGQRIPQAHGPYSVKPAEVIQHLKALNQRYHKLTGKYVKDKQSFYDAIRHMSSNLNDVDSEGRRSLQMLAGLYNESRRDPRFARALQNYAELAPVLV